MTGAFWSSWRTVGDEENIEVLIARDGGKALRIALTERPHLVFLDILMLTMDGYEVSQAVKAGPALASWRVAMRSACPAKGPSKTVRGPWRWGQTATSPGP